jgi:lipopolysaccharide transport system ATP-binding protein
MSQPIITCDKISKSYRLGVKEQGSVRMGTAFTLRESLSDVMHTVTRFFKEGKWSPIQQGSLFWALRDVSFEVERGEVIGIMGRNGAGKSTLLKILSRIVEPTLGSARLRGRLASLLEIGTGFHPELTGRENIYLNGAMLGMRKAEINRKLDQIIAFSEIEKFLDTPVKRYSSGMYIRLAFAVAANLEPEILVVDEVLAVGDYEFQKKCMGKMSDVASGEGRTILFVSHNMGALSQLCERGILLEEGRVTMIGPVDHVIQSYLKSGLNHNTAQVRFPIDPSKPYQFVSAEILHIDGSPGSDFSCDEPVIIRLRFEIRQPKKGLCVSFSIQNVVGTPVLSSNIRDTDPAAAERLGIGLHIFEIKIPSRLLAPTSYLLNVGSQVELSGFLEQQPCCEFTLRELSMAIHPRGDVLALLLPWDHEVGPLKKTSGSPDWADASLKR